MANDFKTTKYILDDVFIRFWNSLSFLRTANRDIEADFKNLRYATGDTLNVRLEERYMGGRGATASPEARIQVSRPLSIDEQFHTLVSYNAKELTFDRARDEPYLRMANGPRAKTLANNVEMWVAKERMMKEVYFATGTPGTPVSFDTLSFTDAVMTEMAIPEDGLRYYGASPRITSTLAQGLTQTYNDRVNEAALIDGFVGHLSGFDIFKTNFLGRQIAGAGEAGGAPPAGFKMAGTITNGPILGGNVFEVTGLIPNALSFTKGDRIEISETAGCFHVNPLTREPTEQRSQFVVVSDVISDSSGDATIIVSPSIETTGARQNISAPIPNGAQLFLREDHNVSLAYHSQAIVFAAPPIKELEGGVIAATSQSDLYKLALTYTLGADIINYKQLDRIDLVAGVLINPEFAVAVCS